MNILLILTGDLASGKSTISSLISKRNDFSLISKDLIKESLADSIGFSNREENLNLSKMTFKLMKESLIKFINDRKNIVMEANFRSYELDEIKQIMNNCDYQVIVYKFEGDNQILYDRFLKRLPFRHKAHTSLHLEESLDKFVEYLSMIREQLIPFNYKIIDSTSFPIEDIYNIINNDIISIN